MPGDGNIDCINVVESHKIHIDRDMPKLIIGYVSDDEWTSFCDELEKTLIPANKFKRNGKIFLEICTFNLLLLIIDIIAIQIILHSRQSDPEEKFPDLRILLIIHLSFTFALSLLFFLFIATWHVRTKQNIQREMRAICREFTGLCRELNETKEPLVFLAMNRPSTEKGYIAMYIEVVMDGGTECSRDTWDTMEKGDTSKPTAGSASETKTDEEDFA